MRPIDHLGNSPCLAPPTYDGFDVRSNCATASVMTSWNDIEIALAEEWRGTLEQRALHIFDETARFRWRTLGCRQPRAARSSPLSSARRPHVRQKFEYEVTFRDGLIAFGDRLIALRLGCRLVRSLPALFGQRGFVLAVAENLSADFSDHGRYARERPPASAGRRPRVQGWRRFLTLGGHWRGFVLTSLAYAAQAPY